MNINDVFEKHSKIMQNLFAAQALTGVWNTSALKALESFPNILLRGNQAVALDDTVKSCVKYVAALYGGDAQSSLDDYAQEHLYENTGGKRHMPPKLWSAPPTIWLHFVHIVDAQVSLQLCGWLLVVPSPQLWMDEEIILSATNLPAQWAAS